MIIAYTFLPNILLRVTPTAKRNTYSVATPYYIYTQGRGAARLNPGLGNRNSYRVAAGCGLCPHWAIFVLLNYSNLRFHPLYHPLTYSNTHLNPHHQPHTYTYPHLRPHHHPLTYTYPHLHPHRHTLTYSNTHLRPHHHPRADTKPHLHQHHHPLTYTNPHLHPHHHTHAYTTPHGWLIYPYLYKNGDEKKWGK